MAVVRRTSAQALSVGELPDLTGNGINLAVLATTCFWQAQELSKYSWWASAWWDARRVTTNATCTAFLFLMHWSMMVTLAVFLTELFIFAAAFMPEWRAIRVRGGRAAKVAENAAAIAKLALAAWAASIYLPANDLDCDMCFDLSSTVSASIGSLLISALVMYSLSWAAPSSSNKETAAMRLV